MLPEFLADIVEVDSEYKKSIPTPTLSQLKTLSPFQLARS
jgi:hypothetical protein